MKPRREKILIFLQAGIGDAIMRIPALKALRDTNAHLTILVANKEIGHLFLKEGLIDEFILTGLGNKSYFIFDKIKNISKVVKLLRKINSINFDVAFYFEGKPLLMTLLSVFINIKNKYIISKYKVSRFYCEVLNAGQHEFHKTISSNKLLLKYGVKNLILHPKLDSFRHVAREKLYIAILSGSSEKEKAKRWSTVEYNELIKLVLNQNSNINFLFFGCENEKDILDKIDIEFKKNIIDYFGKLSLIETIDKLARCNIAIGGDSGLMHVANALNINCVVLFGPTLDHWIKPNGNNVTIFKSDRKCSPCYMKMRFGCADNLCMQDVKADQVASFLSTTKLI